MTDADQRRGLSRRQMLILSAAGGLSAMGLGSGLDADGEQGTLYGGKMALSQAFNVAGDLWVGPDSAKSNVSADSGRMYFASDTQLTYYGDGGSWVSLGVGTSGNKAPASHFQSLSTDVLDTEAVTMYVDPSGSDSNDGLSSSSPKQTIQAALEDAPVHGDYAGRLTLELAEGTYTDTGSGGLLDFRHTWTPTVRINGTTDGSGNPSAIIDGSGFSYCINAYGRQSVELFDLRLENSLQPLGVQRGALVEAFNCEFVGGTSSTRTAYVTHAGTLIADSDCLFDIRPSTTTVDWNIGVTGCATAKLDATIRGGKSEGQVVGAKEGAWVYLQPNAVVDGDGVAEYLMLAQNEANVKAEPATMEGGTTAFQSETNSNIRILSAPTYTSVTNKYDGDEGGFIRTENGEDIRFTARNSTGLPNADIGNPVGATFYAGDSGKLRFNSGVFAADLEAGRQPRTGGTVTVPSGGSVVAEAVSAGNLVETAWNINSDPDAAVNVRKTIQWDDGNNWAEIVFEELSGAGSVEVAYQSWKSVP